MYTTVTWVLLIFGLFFLLFAAVPFHRTRKFLAGAIRTQGKVVCVHDDYDKDSEDKVTYYFLDFEFADEKGKVHKGKSYFGSWRPGYSVGQSIRIWYRPDQPDEACLDSFRSLWGMTAAIFSIGCVMFLAVGIGAYYTAEKPILPPTSPIQPINKTPARVKPGSAAPPPKVTTP